MRIGRRVGFVPDLLGAQASCRLVALIRRIAKSFRAFDGRQILGLLLGGKSSRVPGRPVLPSALLPVLEAPGRNTVKVQYVGGIALAIRRINVAAVQLTIGLDV